VQYIWEQDCSEYFSKVAEKFIASSIFLRILFAFFHPVAVAGSYGKFPHKNGDSL
jgi:hypothetical protein